MYVAIPDSNPRVVGLGAYMYINLGPFCLHETHVLSGPSYIWIHDIQKAMPIRP